MPVYSFKGFIPVIDPSAFVHPMATVTGNVIIGRDVYVGPGAALRGDWGAVVIEDGCNVQENCTLHMFPGKTIRLRKNAHIGHGAIIHGADVGEDCLVGMNSVIMDQVMVGAGSIIGALTFVHEGMEIPERSIVVGNPARIVKQVSDEMLEWKKKGTRLYQSLPNDMKKHWLEVEPLTEIPKDRPAQEILFENWENIKSGK